jgi:CTP synthase (UTP-ammonia lyase)
MAEKQVYFHYRRGRLFLGKGKSSHHQSAKLLIARGFRVTIQKLDPYINIDPGTLNPYEHGECYVTMMVRKQT